MLCNTCNEDIFDDDALKCIVCNECYHFMCVALRETAFRKMSKTSKQRWSCNKCKFETNTINQDHNNLSQVKNLGVTYSNDNLKGLTDSVNFMIDKFDDFGK